MNDPLVHPLCIIQVCDHYTRLSTGGTLLPSTSPTIGLLFGLPKTPISPSVLIDGIELPYTYDEKSTSKKLVFDYEGIKIKYELHTAVFTQHSIIGWYRVGDANNTDSESVTAEDLRLSIEFSKHCIEKPLFLLLNPKITGVGSVSAKKKRVPVNIFELTQVGKDYALLDLQFQLKTDDVERISVEAIIKVKQSGISELESEVLNAAALVASSSAANADVKANPPKIKPSKQSNHERHLLGLLNSVQSLDSRITLITEYLMHVQNKSIKPNLMLLREIEAIVSSLPSNITQSHSHDLNSSLNLKITELLSLELLGSVARGVGSVERLSEKYVEVTKKEEDHVSGGRFGGMY